jgi:hypothetical protein
MRIFSNTNKTANGTKPVLCEVALRKRIDKNRDEIDKWLNGDYPIDLVYMRIRMLSAQNERLISQLKDV